MLSKPHSYVSKVFRLGGGGDIFSRAVFRCVDAAMFGLG